MSSTTLRFLYDMRCVKLISVIRILITILVNIIMITIVIVALGNITPLCAKADKQWAHRYTPVLLCYAMCCLRPYVSGRRILRSAPPHAASRKETKRLLDSTCHLVLAAVSSSNQFLSYLISSYLLLFEWMLPYLILPYLILP